jgi:chorismate mutase
VKALEGLITKPEVEKKLLIRLQKKAQTYASEFSSDGDILPNANGNDVSCAKKLDVDGVVELYESYIIPLTKEVEVSHRYHASETLSLIKLNIV